MLDKVNLKKTDKQALASLKNKVIYDAGYLSTTLKREKVETSAQKCYILLIIHVPAGKRALPATKDTEGRQNADQLRYEEEILFPPGQKIRIISAEQSKSGKSSIIIRGILL